MLYSYKMIVDKGFAPNPFYGYLTPSTCKPYIRLTKVKGSIVHTARYGISNACSSISDLNLIII